MRTNTPFYCAAFAIFSMVFFGLTLQTRADIYPPAITVNGITWGGGGGSYSGGIFMNGAETYANVYVSGGTATLSGGYWQDGYYAGGWDLQGDGTSQWDPNSNWVDGTWVPYSNTGTYSRGVFSVPGASVVSTDSVGNSWPPYPSGTPSDDPVAGGPPQLWINGMQFYRFSTGNTDYYYSFDYFDYIAVQGTSVTSSESLSVSGTWTPNASGGVFLMSNPAVDVRPLAADGSMMHTTAPTLSGPPGVSVNGQAWPFQGSVGDVDYYLGGIPGQALTISPTLAVNLNDPDNAVSNAAGVDNNGVFQDLPETVRSLDTHGIVMANEGRGPASVVVNSVPWVHSNVGGASYDAYFGPVSGQMLYIYGGTVWMADPANNVNSSGTFTAGAFQMDNTGELVQSGDQGGVVLPATPQTRTQDSPSDTVVQGNMAIYGNVLTLGTWQGNQSTAGLSLSFADRPPSGDTGASDAPSAISLVAYRGSNQWMWSHATNSFTSTMPMMQLDPTNRLTLYSPVDGTVQVVLDPQGPSIFHGPVRMQGPLRIPQRGDLSMGAYTNSPGM